ncbi:hypothetical protein Sked_08100 [Sanguibacter keddieii DSM 10542]|uniref:ABC transporter permease n=1 Tax=Sanguibacter keddieii (strain ATCC 51767 / DSM 10542 / NCFB 3025 / ST-74) TaxID=446469 RepID=D1BBY1_SANKS|nr:ABC transporter permease subunit [Sanguibacter keddieii]ACZ20761.1 hypothetical protein Sked_08100 [Sanguibacter keddieii DSM 10542]
MSTETLTRSGATTPKTDQYKVTFPRLVKSETIKLATVRSTIWSLAVAIVIIVGFAVLMAFALRSQDIPDFGSELSLGATVATFGIGFGQLVIVVLGVLSIGSEYSTGMIRSTFSAAPTRIPALLAKMLVLAVMAFVASAIALFAAFFVAQAILPASQTASLGDPQVLRMLVGGALFLAVMAIFSVAVGAIVRSTAAGISIIVGLIFILPGLLTAIPWEWVKTIGRYLPDSGMAVFSEAGIMPHEPWTGFAILVAWAVAATLVASVLVKRRDA